VRNKINKIIVEYRADTHINELIKGAFLAFVLKVGGAALSFGLNVAIARMLGPEGAGQYFLAMAVATICSVIARVGLDNTLLRFIAEKNTNKDLKGVQEIYLAGMYLAMVISLLTTIFLFASSAWLGEKIFKNKELIEPLRWMSLTIIPFTLLNLHSESLKGLKRLKQAMLLQNIGVALVAVILLAPLVSYAAVNGAVMAYLFGTVIVAIFAVYIWKKIIPKNQFFIKPFSVKILWKSCRHLFVTSLMIEAVRPWAPLFLLGIWTTTEDVGIFGAAMRLVSLTTFMMATLNNVLAPKLVELYTNNELDSFESTARYATIINVLFASPIFLLMIFGSHWVMSVYGQNFSEGAAILSILTIGQVVNVLTGSLGLILIITGNEKKMQNMTIYSTFALILLMIIMTPVWGGIGAALAITISGTGLSVATAIYIRKILKIKAIPLIN
jgi:O-antigen/teichoic acid export membrane protein